MWPQQSYNILGLFTTGFLHITPPPSYSENFAYFDVSKCVQIKIMSICQGLKAIQPLNLKQYFHLLNVKAAQILTSAGTHFNYFILLPLLLLLLSMLFLLVDVNSKFQIYGQHSFHLFVSINFWGTTVTEQPYIYYIQKYGRKSAHILE